MNVRTRLYEEVDYSNNEDNERYRCELEFYHGPRTRFGLSLRRQMNGIFTLLSFAISKSLSTVLFFLPKVIQTEQPRSQGLFPGLGAGKRPWGKGPGNEVVRLNMHFSELFS